MAARGPRMTLYHRTAFRHFTHGDTVAGADYNFAGLASPATVPASLPRCECGHVLTAHGRYGCEAPCDDDVTSTCACTRRKSAPGVVAGRWRMAGNPSGDR